MLIAPTFSTNRTHPRPHPKRAWQAEHRRLSLFSRTCPQTEQHAISCTRQRLPHQQASRTYPKLRPTKAPTTARTKPAPTARTLVPFIVDAHPAFLVFAVPHLHSFPSFHLLIRRLRVTPRAQAQMVMVVASMGSIPERRHPSPPFQYMCDLSF